mgnify:FL=1
MTPNLTEVEKLLQLVYPILNLRCPELIPVLKNPVDFVHSIDCRIRYLW